MFDRYSRILASFAALGGLAAAGCGDDEDDTIADTDGATTGVGTDATTTMTTTTADGTGTETGETGTTGMAVGTAMLRLIHAAPDAPPVDVYVAGSQAPLISGLGYGETSDYLEVDAGDYVLEVRPAGTPATNPPVFQTGTVSLEENAMVTALAAGLLGSESANEAFRVVPLVEEFTMPSAGNAIVRVVHAGADAPTVGIDVGNDGTVEVEALERFADTGAPGVEIPAGEELQVGIVAGGETVTSFTTPQLPDGAELFVIATGLLERLPREQVGFSLLAVGPTGTVALVRQDPRVFALHASPDAGSVDICAGQTELVSELPYAMLAPVRVQPGEYDLALFPAGTGCDGEAVGTFGTGELRAGEQYLAIATGELMPEGDDPMLTLALFAEEFSLDAAAGSGVVRVVHAASAPEVAAGVVMDGQIAEADVLVPSLAWGEQSDELEVPAMTYPIGLVPADAMFPATPVAIFEVPIEAGDRTWVVAAGQVTGTPGLALWTIDTTEPAWSLTNLGGVD